MIENNTANFNSNYGFFGQVGTTVLSGNSAHGNTPGDFLVACPGSVTGNSGTITFNGTSTTCVVANN